MKRFLVSKASVNYALDVATGDIAGAWDIAALTDGALAAFEADGTLIDDTTPSVDTDYVYFAIGRYGVGAAELSPLVDRATLEVVKQEYTAPVAKVMYIGDDASSTYDLNLPDPLVSGTPVIVDIIDLSLPEYKTERVITVEYVITDGDTQSSILTNLVAAINANARAYALVLAATSNTTVGTLGLSLTGQTAGKNFTAKVRGVLEDADVVEYQMVNGVYTSGETTPVNVTVGYGTSAQMAALEAAYSVHEGNINSNYLGNQLYSKTSNVVTGETYTTYSFTWRNPRNSEFPSDQSVKQTLVIAIPHDETGAGKAITAMDNIIAVL